LFIRPFVMHFNVHSCFGVIFLFLYICNTLVLLLAVCKSGVSNLFWPEGQVYKF